MLSRSLLLTESSKTPPNLIFPREGWGGGSLEIKMEI